MRIPELAACLERFHSRGVLGHAYLFFGEDVKALETLVQAFAGYLEGGITPRIDFAVVPGTGAIGIDEVRVARRFLSGKPFRSPRRTFFFPRAERMTAQAAHALLKLAEEPPPSGLLMLTARDLGALLPTLVSRFVRFYVHTVPVAVPQAMRSRVKAFRAASPKERSELIKALIEDPEDVIAFVAGMIAELRVEPTRNWRAMKELLGRLRLMQDYSLNRRLQLEAALQGV